MAPESGQEIAPVVVPVQSRIIVWDNGVPRLAVEPVLARHHIQAIYFVAAAQPFACDDPLDPDFARYDGMTCAEVMVRKQVEGAARSGDTDEIERVMDRLIGKPLAKSESTHVHATYEEALRAISEKARPVDAVEVGPGHVSDREIFGDLL